jgi:NAD(P)-dependent dehydrogenase (short-subunit alcohol dehydrogenase family)
MKRLSGKVAVIYGSGTVGVSVAEAFAREGAKVVLTPHREVDALDEAAVGQHLDAVIKKEGKLDVSFNAIGIPQKGIQGTALTELPVKSYMLPVVTYSQSHFITATAAARQMAKQGSGVILGHTPNASRISPPFVGGMVPAWSAIEGFYRSLSVECAELGIRTV